MVEFSSESRLVKLGDENLTVADPAEDIRGRKVVDSNGDEIGDIDDLLVDTKDTKVRFLQVSAGGFLGIGERKFLIPVDAITRVSPDEVHINQTRDHVAGGPMYDPALADQRYLTRTYDYYGLTPYWGPGYVYPAYPYY